MTSCVPPLRYGRRNGEFLILQTGVLDLEGGKVACVVRLDVVGLASKKTRFVESSSCIIIPYVWRSRRGESHGVTAQ